MICNYDINVVAEICIKAAYYARKAVLDVYNKKKFKIMAKEDNSPLTRADIASHTKISDVLSSEFQNVPILSEEGKNIPFKERIRWDSYFCVDPLDGTKEFINRNGEFTINVAFMKGTSPVMGIICIPVKDILYFGGDTYGSFRLKSFSK